MQSMAASAPLTGSVLVREVDGSVVPAKSWPIRRHTVALDEELVVGREGDLALGIDLDDSGISRRALIVGLRRGGWHLKFGNRNGAVLQLWSQAPTWINRDSEQTLFWPRIGIRFVGHGRDNE